MNMNGFSCGRGGTGIDGTRLLLWWWRNIVSDGEHVCLFFALKQKKKTAEKKKKGFLLFCFILLLRLIFFFFFNYVWRFALVTATYEYGKLRMTVCFSNSNVRVWHCFIYLSSVIAAVVLLIFAVELSFYILLLCHYISIEIKPSCACRSCR